MCTVVGRAGENGGARSEAAAEGTEASSASSGMARSAEWLYREVGGALVSALSSAFCHPVASALRDAPFFLALRSSRRGWNACAGWSLPFDRSCGRAPSLISKFRSRAVMYMKASTEYAFRRFVDSVQFLDRALAWSYWTRSLRGRFSVSLEGRAWEYSAPETVIPASLLTYSESFPLSDVVYPDS